MGDTGSVQVGDEHAGCTRPARRVTARISAATTARFFGGTMPIATPEKYKAMLDAAKAGGFAYPAINVTSSETINAALKGFADAGSDGIIQVSTGGGEFAPGTSVKDKVTGAVALAEFANVVAAKYDITVALHTDHCPKDKLDSYVRPLLAISTERVRAGRNPLFQSHMWDGSAIPMAENLKIAQELLPLTKAANIILEIEIGVVGGEEDGVVGEASEKMYTTPADFLQTLDVLGDPQGDDYIVAATFGNVHGVYKPGNVKLRPSVLRAGQDAVAKELGLAAGAKPFGLVFHGGSGSSAEEIAEAVSYGVVKMNIDTDAQYAFTRPIVGHLFTNYDGVLKVDGEVGNKKAYDPRSYLKLAEAGMAARVVEACQQLGSAGTSGK
jgi:fructose-bisphosphate aldolase class II